MLDRVKALAPQHPEWKKKEPFKSVLAGDLKGVAKSGEKGIVELGMATHAGMTTDEFDKIVTDWFATARHPKLAKPYNEITYLPMRELLDYLRANGFKTYIVSGGGVEFMRPMTEKMYGIPPEQVVGSTIVTQYATRRRRARCSRRCRRSTSSTTARASRSASTSSSAGGRSSSPAIPTATTRCCAGSPRPTDRGFGMIVHHTDAEREYAYDRKSHFGKLDKALTRPRSATGCWST